MIIVRYNVRSDTLQRKVQDVIKEIKQIKPNNNMWECVTIIDIASC